MDKDPDNSINVMFEGNYTESKDKKQKVADIYFNADTISLKI